MSRVLVVDDEGPMRRALEINLVAREFDVSLAATGEEALRLAARDHPDVVLLDLGLPGISGLDVIDGLRGWTNVPIIVVSARDAEGEKVRALDAGADDYVTKPFQEKELLARVRAQLRRAARSARTNQPLRIGHLELREAEGRVLWDGREVVLTRTEFRLLTYLAEHPNLVLSRQALLEQVWGYDHSGDGRLVDAHVRRLRTKIEIDPTNPTIVQTVRGLGYRLTP